MPTKNNNYNAKAQTPPSCPFEAIIFDIDGTLSDSTQLCLDATNEVLQRHGIAPVSAATYHAHTRYTTPDRLARHAGLQPTDADFGTTGATLGREFDDLYIGLVSIETARFFDGVGDLLQQGIPTTTPLGALTNAAVAYAHAVLQVNSHALTGSDELYGRFGSIRGADNVPAAKPAPDGLYAVCNDLGLHNDQQRHGCAYVGDSPSDAHAAKAAGMTAVGVVWGSHTRSSFEAAPFDVICETVDELQTVLEQGVAVLSPPQPNKV